MDILFNPINVKDQKHVDKKNSNVSERPLFKSNEVTLNVSICNSKSDRLPENSCDCYVERWSLITYE